MIASMAALPSQSLANLMAKMEVLLARLAPDDGTETSLCIAEVSLLRSVLRDLQAFVTGTVLSTRGTEPWIAGSTQPTFVQGNGTCSSAGSSLLHHQI